VRRKTGALWSLKPLDRSSPAGAKDDSRDAEVLAHALRIDMPAFRKLALAEPLVV
jgi:hypothetical protein